MGNSKEKKARLYAAHRKWCKAHPEHYNRIQKARYHRTHPGAKTVEQIQTEKKAKSDRSEKPCKKCGIVKPMEDFIPWSRTADGRTYQCRICIAETVRKRYAANPDKMMVPVKKWQKNNRDKTKHIAHKRRARKRGIPGSHTLAQWKRLCAAFDNRCVKCGKRRLLTKDHIIPISNPNSNNAISNLQPLCSPCNSAKGNRHTVDYRKTPFTGLGQSILFE